MVMFAMTSAAENLVSIAEQSSAVAEAAEGAVSSLILLRQIEQTDSALCSLRKQTSAIAKTARNTYARIEKVEPKLGKLIDPDDEIISLLKSAYESFESEIPKFLVMKSTIDMDDRLRGDQKEFLHSTYDEALSSIGHMIEAMKDLRAALIRHDLAAEPRDLETFDDIKKLSAALRA
jgi:hypothetical protein